MSAPPVRSARDVPELRLWLLDQWQPGRAYYQSAKELRPESTNPHVGWMEAPFDQRALRDGALWWVSGDMVELVTHAAKSLDDVVLDRSLPPERAALVVLERPLVGLDASNPDTTVQVDALLWGAGVLERGPDGVVVPYYSDHGYDVVGVSTYRRIDFGDGLHPDELQLALNRGALDHADLQQLTSSRRGIERATTFNATGSTWVPLGRTDWRYGERASAAVLPGLEPQRLQSQEEDRRWLAALWLLASQPNVVDVEATAALDRPTMRRSQRRGVTSAVRLVDLRRSHAAHEHVEGEHGERHYSVRWMVSGHWRNQAVGPNRSQRRPTWIAPYVKGPEDKPLMVRPTVKVVR